MSLTDEPDDETTLEECIQELDELIMSLDRYSSTTVAVAMGTCLEGLLGALLDEGRCAAEEIHELLQEIETEVLQRQPPAKR